MKQQNEQQKWKLKIQLNLYESTQSDFKREYLDINRKLLIDSIESHYKHNFVWKTENLFKH